MRQIATIVIIGLILTSIPFSLANAQDYYELYRPTMNPPSISIASPQNNSIVNTNSLQLTFNITKPQIIKLSPNISLNIIENNGVRNSTEIFRVNYKGDWQTEEQTLYSNENGGLDFLEINETISNIPNGEHEIQITAIGSVDLIVTMFGFTYHPDSSSTIIFTINPSTPTPTVPEISWLMILSLFLSLLAFAALIRKKEDSFALFQ